MKSISKHKFTLLYILMVVCFLLSASWTFAGESGTSAATVPKQPESVEICTSAADFSAAVRSNMLARNAVFSIKYTGNAPENVLTLDTFNQFLTNISNIDDPATSSDCDYLKLNWTQAQLTIANHQDSLIYTFSFKYLTTAEEEAYVDKKVQNILTSLNISNSSDIEKVKAVSNYIIRNVSYDSSFEHKSAYDALNSGTAICRGYVLLAYKMLQDLSVPVRIITGTGCDKPHVWNLVEIDGAWYNLDLTWDDTTHSDSFFLKGTTDFGFHKSDTYFNSDSFKLQYPISAQSYSE